MNCCFGNPSNSYENLSNYSLWDQYGSYLTDKGVYYTTKCSEQDRILDESFVYSEYHFIEKCCFNWVF